MIVVGYLFVSRLSDDLRFFCVGCAPVEDTSHEVLAVPHARAAEILFDTLACLDCGRNWSACPTEEVA